MSIFDKLISKQVNSTTNNIWSHFAFFWSPSQVALMRPFINDVIMIGRLMYTLTSLVSGFYFTLQLCWISFPFEYLFQKKQPLIYFQQIYKYVYIFKYFSQDSTREIYIQGEGDDTASAVKLAAFQWKMFWGSLKQPIFLDDFTCQHFPGIINLKWSRGEICVANLIPPVNGAS